MTPWEIKGRELINCNCSYGCPCQFNALPTNGDCKAMGAISVDSGRYGDVRLDGLKIAFVFAWPGPIHLGKGSAQPVVDSKADPKQREALLKIMSGQDTEPGATVFNVFAATFEKMFDPVFADITFDVDVEKRTGKVAVPGVFEMKGEPIRNPVTGSEHRARIDLPDGFEYLIAEIGSASSRSQGNIAFELKDSYGQFAHLHLTGKGPVKAKRAA